MEKIGFKLGVKEREHSVIHREDVGGRERVTSDDYD